MSVVGRRGDDAGMTDPTSETVQAQPLTDVERAMLDLEGGTWRVPGLKEQAIKDRFGMTSTRYYQRLNSLLSRREAWEYAPTTVSRLRRVRAAHARSKTVRQSA